MNNFTHKSLWAVVAGCTHTPALVNVGKGLLILLLSFGFMFPSSFTLNAQSVKDKVALDAPRIATEMMTGTYELSLKKLENAEITGKTSITARIDGPDLTTVSYAYENVGRVNPYSGGYEYQVRKVSTGYAVDMFAMLSDFDTYLEKRIVVSYEGEPVLFPFEMSPGLLLPSSNGTILLSLPGESLQISYDVSISNREVVDEKTIRIQGESFTAYEIRYDFSKVSKVNNRLQSSSNAVGVDLYVPRIGIVSRSRTGHSNYADNKITFNQRTIINE